MNGLRLAQSFAALGLATLALQVFTITVAPFREFAWMLLGCPDRDEFRTAMSVVTGIAIVLAGCAVWSMHMAVTA